ncbi:MAG: DUF2934 domain-containing protein [Candidatus Accumulibacter sp.]|jgi:hypothetical protein|nr:DUF2934 domain-containing protein [Accumulibacter sp.]
MAEVTPKTSAPKKTTARQTKADINAKAGGKAEPEKTAPKKSPAKPAAVKKTPVLQAPVEKMPVEKRIVDGEQRYRMIAEAAYFRAERCDFKSDPVRDWIEAERDIAILLGEDE